MAVTRHGKLSGLLVPLSERLELPVELRRELLNRLGAGIASHWTSPDHLLCDASELARDPPGPVA
jgi:hypothetical protein